MKQEKKHTLTSGWHVSSVLVIAQIVFSFFLSNDASLQVLEYVGWAILVIGLAVGYMGASAVRRKGEVPKGKSSVHTTFLAGSGIYAVVRHPQYLSWVFISLAMILISQHWLVVAIGVAAMVAIYIQARQDDKSFIEKFGDDYKRYMQSVPGLNFLVGLIRLMERRR